MKATRSPARLRQLGQGMTEYIIIVILVAIAAIGVYMYFGKTVREDVAGMAQEMSGQSSSQAQQQAKQAAGQAQSEADKDKGLGSYDNPQGK
jgi:Tfp pilus assembly protein PilV